jgi:hypothetical protein
VEFDLLEVEALAFRQLLHPLVTKLREPIPITLRSARRSGRCREERADQRGAAPRSHRRRTRLIAIRFLFSPAWSLIDRSARGPERARARPLANPQKPDGRPVQGRLRPGRTDFASFRPMRGSAALACALAAATGCTSPGVGSPECSSCALVAGVLGGIAGAALAHPRRARTAGRTVGAGVGALGGAALGWLLCGQLRAKFLPQVRIDAQPSSGEAPLAVQLTAAVAPERFRIVRYEWDFGDGSRASGPLVSHVFLNPGDLARGSP